MNLKIEVNDIKEVLEIKIHSVKLELRDGVQLEVRRELAGWIPRIIVVVNGLVWHSAGASNEDKAWFNALVDRASAVHEITMQNRADSMRHAIAKYKTRPGL